MGWIGIADHEGGQFDAAGLAARSREGSSRPTAIAAEALLSRGTILLETQVSYHGRPQTLLGFHRSYPWPGGLVLKSLPGGGIVMVAFQGDDLRHATLPLEPDRPADTLRLTYSWDAPARTGRLTLEQPDGAMVHTVAVDRPHPMPLAELQRMIRDPRQRETGPDVAFFALSDRMEPVGPMPGLAGDVPVALPHGHAQMRDLKRGDLVCTVRGRNVPVLKAVSRVVPARGSFRPVLLRAPYFGLCRDIVVAPQQRLLISGAQVEYMFGKEAVLVAARHLVNGVSARHVDGPGLVRYHHLLLPGHEALLTAGAALESLYVARLRRRPGDLAASVLAGCDRAGLPEHPCPVEQVLRPHEAIALATSHAA